MKKILEGILAFRKANQEGYREKYQHLSGRQNPNVVWISCSDSRIEPSKFAEIEPGDLFTIRNVGNQIPQFSDSKIFLGVSEAAALEFSLENLPITDIIICGHSDCGAMQAIEAGLENVSSPSLKKWLSIDKKETILFEPDSNLEKCDQISQKHIIHQLYHLKAYPIIGEKLKKKTLRIHGWFYRVGKGDIHFYDQKKNQFILLDEKKIQELLKEFRI